MIFSGELRRLDHKNVEQSLRAMENHIRSLQEQLEYTLYNLDSTNIQSLDTALTDIISSQGGINISGDSLMLCGSDGEKIVMGAQGGGFQLQLAGRGGQPAIYLDGSGDIVVGSAAKVYLDCGCWDGQ